MVIIFSNLREMYGFFVIGMCCEVFVLVSLLLISVCKQRCVLVVFSINDVSLCVR